MYLLFVIIINEGEIMRAKDVLNLGIKIFQQREYCNDLELQP